MSDTYELKAAVLAAKEVTKLPVFATMIFDDKGKLLTGGDIAAAVALLEGLGVDALGFNCGLGPDQMKGLLPELMACASLPVIVNPNAGLPRSENGRTVFDVSPEAFAADMEAMAAGGACCWAGCCGTTPAHLAAMIGRCRGITPPPVTARAHGGFLLRQSGDHRRRAGHRGGADQSHGQGTLQAGPAGKRHGIHPAGGDRPAGKRGPCAGRQRGAARKSTRPRG